MTPGLTVSIVDTSISEADGDAATTATVTRNTETTEPLSVNLSSSDVTEAAVPASVTIPAGESSVTFEIDAVDDTVVDGTQSVAITAVAAGLEDGIETLDVTDDEVAGFTISETGGSTVVSEAETTDELTVVLVAQPLSDVVLTVSSSDTTEATVSPTTLTFTPADWDTPQTVTVTGVDDIALDGDQTSIITIAVDADLTDDAFSTLSSQTVSVNVLGTNPPDDISLSDDSVTENADTSTASLLVGTMSTSLTVTDPDETFVYELFEGEGETDNALVEIVDDELFVNQGVELDFETKSSYLVRVRSTTVLPRVSWQLSRT